jgi:hypothetical protein
VSHFSNPVDSRSISAPRKEFDPEAPEYHEYAQKNVFVASAANRIIRLPRMKKAPGGAFFHGNAQA